MGDLAGASVAWPPAIAGINAPLCLSFLTSKMELIAVPSL